MIYFLALSMIVSTVILTLYVQYTVRCAKKAAKWDVWEAFRYDFKVDWFTDHGRRVNTPPVRGSFRE